MDPTGGHKALEGSSERYRNSSRFDMIQNPSRSAILRRLLDDQYRCRQHKKRTKLPILNLRHRSASISTMLMRPACSAYLRANTKTCMTATQTVRVDANSAASSRLRRGASFSDDSYRGNANIYHPVYSYASAFSELTAGLHGHSCRSQKMPRYLRTCMCARHSIIALLHFLPCKRRGGWLGFETVST